MPLKQMKKITTLAICLLAAVPLLPAQDVSTAPLVWSVNQLKDLNTQKEQGTYTCTFATHGTAPLQWVQQNNYITTFTVKKISGSWTNVQQPGRAVFEIAADTETGTLTFERTATGLTATLDLSQGTRPRLKMSYSVAQVK
jgi:hypothetical protein